MPSTPISVIDLQSVMLEAMSLIGLAVNEARAGDLQRNR
jgi:hypothetical protein